MVNAPVALTSFGSPKEPSIENAVKAINTVFKDFSFDFSTLSNTDKSVLYTAYKDIERFLAVAKASNDPDMKKRAEIARHWIDQLNVPRDGVEAKLNFLESQINRFTIEKTNASLSLADLVGAGVNKLSSNAQPAKATNPG